MSDLDRREFLSTVAAGMAAGVVPIGADRTDRAGAPDTPAAEVGGVLEKDFRRWSLCRLWPRRAWFLRGRFPVAARNIAPFHAASRRGSWAL